jgi:hypothetical protein
MTEILDYIEAQSPQGARHVNPRLQAVIELPAAIPAPAAQRTRMTFVAPW